MDRHLVRLPEGGIRPHYTWSSKVTCPTSNVKGQNVEGRGGSHGARVPGRGSKSRRTSQVEKPKRSDSGSVSAPTFPSVPSSRLRLCAFVPSSLPQCLLIHFFSHRSRSITLASDDCPASISSRTRFSFSRQSIARLVISASFSRGTTTTPSSSATIQSPGQIFMPPMRMGALISPKPFGSPAVGWIVLAKTGNPSARMSATSRTTRRSPRPPAL